MKYTKGPWKIENGIIYPENGRRDESGNRYAVCCMSEELNPKAGTLEFTDYHKEHKANITLIAAAPELLEACKELIAAIQYALPHCPKKHHGLQDYKDAAFARLRAQSAIAKAEGK